MALLRSSPFFLKAPLRGEGRAARCLLAKCLWSSCRQAGRTSWSRTLQAGCGVHPLPGGRQQLAQGARRTGGRLRLTAYQHQQSRRTKSRYFFLKAPLRGEGCDGALLTCEVPVELVTPNRSKKLVKDSAGRLRPTAAARPPG